MEFYHENALPGVSTDVVDVGSIITLIFLVTVGTRDMPGVGRDVNIVVEC